MSKRAARLVVGLLVAVAACNGGSAADRPATPRAKPDEPAASEVEREAAAPTQAASESDSSASDSSASDSGTTTAGPPPGRLCSRPYDVSSTPGKGSQPANADRGASEARARKRLAQGLEVQVDDRERQAWTPKLGVEFDDLDPSGDHLIEIFDSHGDRLQRLRLDFHARGSDDLCLGFNSFYGTWQLRALRTGARCGPCVTR